MPNVVHSAGVCFTHTGIVQWAHLFLCEFNS